MTKRVMGAAGGGGGEWKYTGEYFDKVFQGFPKDEGVVYQHYPRDIIFLGKVLYPITVMQAMKKGNLVTTEDSDRVVWVETKRRYEDDEKLDQGYYIRRGSFEYETALGAEKTVARYVEVTDKKMLQNIENAKQELEAKEKAEEEARVAKKKAEQEAREAERKAEEERREAERKAEEARREAERKAEEARRAAEQRAKEAAAKQAAEQGAYELDIPIKSLCGFKLGAPPSQVQDLLQHDDGTPVQNLYRVHNGDSFRLAKPFRLFTNVKVEFADRGFGKHLVAVKLWGKIAREKTTEESWRAEMKAIAEMIGKKFGIRFSQDYDGDYSWRDENGKEFINIVFGYNGMLSMEFGSHVEVERFDRQAKEAQKTSINLDADAGADDL